MPEHKTSIGCVIMASGMGTRFQTTTRANKLLVPFLGKPLICHILETTGNFLFSKRVVVTRHPEILALCREQGIDAILHDLPERSDTVRLGLEALLASPPENPSGPLCGCLFCPADQPLLRRETLEAMLDAFPPDGSRILRTVYRAEADKAPVPGSPVLFGSFFFPELLRLPQGKGGSVLVKKYPERVIYVPVRDPYELADVDTLEALSELTRHLPERTL